MLRVRALLFSVGLGCGPTLDVADGGSSDSGSMETSGVGETVDPSATGLTTIADGESSATGSSTAGSMDTSTGADPFEDADVLGGWVCTGRADPFFMRVDDYASPSELHGEVCASWNRDPDPLQWAPCGSLSAHPIGGGPYVPILARDHGLGRRHRHVRAPHGPVTSCFGALSSRRAADGR